MHDWIHPDPIEATVERLARCGYDAIEISAEQQQKRPFDDAARSSAKFLRSRLAELAAEAPAGHANARPRSRRSWGSKRG